MELRFKTNSLKSARLKTFCICLLLNFGLPVLAQQSCQNLVDSIELAFENAKQVIMSTEIMQGNIEYAYTKFRLYKDEAGTWQSEQLEQRGIPRPPDDQAEEGEEPSFAFACDSHKLISTGSGWDLAIEEANKDLPIKNWQMSFTRTKGNVVPTVIAGNIEARILLIPFKGHFATTFTDWQF
jgi:hypothetical protein